MSASRSLDAESLRLVQDARREKNWKRWGPYLAERQWATVREDYSEEGTAWEYFPHEHSRSRAYRWGEDGLLGICDRECRLCFALSLWNGVDPFLKERLFGVTGPQGNHGEDVKECYFYLDSTPTHSYLKALYKYPQAAFPYEKLLEEDVKRTRRDPEYELLDTGVFDQSRYFDVFAEYAKASPDDVLIRITIANRGPDAARIHALPTLWFRNSWSWGRTGEGYWPKPRISLEGHQLIADHATLGRFRLGWGPELGGSARALFTDNQTNSQRLFKSKNESGGTKDGFHLFVVRGDASAMNEESAGTKAAVHSVIDLPAGAQKILRLRLSAEADVSAEPFGPEFERIFEQRIQEANAFYGARERAPQSEEESQIVRQACAGLLWSKQFYHYDVKAWLEGDPAQPLPPEKRKRGRNHDWTHLYSRDVLSMPDKWEYPWFASWDLAFHMVPFAAIDPEFAKEQLILLLREWYMHPNGQIPAYEFDFSDANPPVHAWAVWRVYKITGQRGTRDRRFLIRAFEKLLLNFTWWVNRKDAEGRHLFSGGFLGLDNIGVFDRSKPLPGAQLDQADGTAWMAFFCATMLAIALELAREDTAYDDIASKFFEHFVAIADAINSLGGKGLWDEEDGFYYDLLRVDGSSTPLRVRSMVGLIPLLAVEPIEEKVIDRLPGFKKRMSWFLQNRKDLARHITYLESGTSDAHNHLLLALPSRERLQHMLRYALDENEFYSPYGVRSLSRIHQGRPFVFRTGNEERRVEYEPGESISGLFGGNSNWRGPVWFPLNYLLIEAFERYHHFYRDALRVECPTGSGKWMTLSQVARDLSSRLARLFLPGPSGDRPALGGDRRFVTDPHWKDLLLFHEYFHGDTGRGLGASHQTGWTALVVRCIEDLARSRESREKAQQKSPAT